MSWLRWNQGVWGSGVWPGDTWWWEGHVYYIILCIYIYICIIVSKRHSATSQNQRKKRRKTMGEHLWSRIHDQVSKALPWWKCFDSLIAWSQKISDAHMPSGFWNAVLDGHHVTMTMAMVPLPGRRPLPGNPLGAFQLVFPECTWNAKLVHDSFIPRAAFLFASEGNTAALEFIRFIPNARIPFLHCKDIWAMTDVKFGGQDRN